MPSIALLVTILWPGVLQEKLLSGDERPSARRNARVRGGRIMLPPPSCAL